MSSWRKRPHCVKETRVKRKYVKHGQPRVTTRTFQPRSPTKRFASALNGNMLMPSAFSAPRQRCRTRVRTARCRTTCVRAKARDPHLVAALFVLHVKYDGPREQHPWNADDGQHDDDLVHDVLARKKFRLHRGEHEHVDQADEQTGSVLKRWPVAALVPVMCKQRLFDQFLHAAEKPQVDVSANTFNDHHCIRPGPERSRKQNRCCAGEVAEEQRRREVWCNRLLRPIVVSHCRRLFFIHLLKKSQYLSLFKTTCCLFQQKIQFLRLARGLLSIENSRENLHTPWLFVVTHRHSSQVTGSGRATIYDTNSASEICKSEGTFLKLTLQNI